MPDRRRRLQRRLNPRMSSPVTARWPTAELSRCREIVGRMRMVSMAPAFLPVSGNFQEAIARRRCPHEPLGENSERVDHFHRIF
jgi:hypothetical protein